MCERIWKLHRARKFGGCDWVQVCCIIVQTSDHQCALVLSLSVSYFNSSTQDQASVFLSPYKRATCSSIEGKCQQTLARISSQRLTPSLILQEIHDISVCLSSSLQYQRRDFIAVASFRLNLNAKDLISLQA